MYSPRKAPRNASISLVKLLSIVLRNDAALPLPSDAIDGIKVYGGNRADHDIGKIKLGKRHLFAREPFVTGMPADMDNHIRFENIAKVFVKRQVLMMRGHYVRTVQTVGVRLPSALR